MSPLTRKQALDQLASQLDCYGSHRRLLIKAMLATDAARPALEMGMGLGSSSDLHDLCLVEGRELVSVESDPFWFGKFAGLQHGGHEVILADECISAVDRREQWSVALVDQKPASERQPSIVRLKGRCDIIVVHDIGTDAPGMDVMRPLFKYAVEDPWKPETAALSDTIDVTGWHLGLKGWFDTEDKVE